MQVVDLRAETAMFEKRLLFLLLLLMPLLLPLPPPSPLLLLLLLPLLLLLLLLLLLQLFSPYEPATSSAEQLQSVHRRRGGHSPGPRSRCRPAAWGRTA